MRQNDVALANIYLEHGIGQGFNDRALEFDYIVFCQSKIPPKSVLSLTCHAPARRHETGRRHCPYVPLFSRHARVYA
jgi:hypothetical protein